MPNALLEAMAAGLPVVATNVEGSREVIVSERSGLLVAPANSEELAKAMLRVLNDSALARELVRNSQSDVINRFTNYAMVGAYERLYHELISRD
jgi:glycosyltransferase involved in cell wall biosynthesis